MDTAWLISSATTMLDDAYDAHLGVNTVGMAHTGPSARCMKHDGTRKWQGEVDNQTGLLEY